MRAALVVLIVAAGLLGTLQDRFIGLLLYLWFAFFRPQEWAWSEIANLRLSLVAGIALVIPSIMSGTIPNLTHPLSIGTLMFLGTGVIAHFNAIRPAVSLDALDELSRIMIVSLLAVTLIADRKKFLIALTVVVASLGFHGSKFGISYLIHGGAKFTTGIGGMFSDNNDFGLAIARIIFLIIACGQNFKQRWAKPGFYGVSLLCVMCVIGTYSRGAALAVAAGTLMLIVLQKRRFAVLSGVAALALAAYLTVPIPETYLNRLNTIANYDTVETDNDKTIVGDESALGRLHYWQVAVQMAIANPFGVGLKNYMYAYDRYDFSQGAFGTRKAVHSSHFQALAETGFLGLTLWLFLIVWSTRTLFVIRSRSKAPGLRSDVQRFYLTMANGLLASMVAFVVGGSFLSQMPNDLNWLTFSLVASLDLLGSGSRRRSEGDGRLSRRGGSGDPGR